MGQSEYVDFLNPKEEIVIVYLAIIISALSFLGSSFIVAVHSSYRSVRGFAFKLIVYLSVADILHSTGKLLLIGYINDYALENDHCYLQAFLINFGGLASFAWASVISYTIYKTVVENTRNIESYEADYLKFAYGLPFFMSLIPFLTDDYGPAGGWCWIRLRKDQLTRGMIMSLVFFYIPLWVAVVYNLRTYMKVVEFLREYLDERLDQKLVRRISLFPMILVVCWSFATIDKFYNFFGKKKFILTALHIAFSCMQGLLNAIVYGMNKTIQLVLQESFAEKCPCIPPPRQDPTGSTNESPLLELQERPTRKSSSIQIKRESELQRELLYFQ